MSTIQKLTFKAKRTSIQAIINGQTEIQQRPNLSGLDFVDGFSEIEQQAFEARKAVFPTK